MRRVSLALAAFLSAGTLIAGPYDDQAVSSAQKAKTGSTAGAAVSVPSTGVLKQVATRYPIQRYPSLDAAFDALNSNERDVLAKVRYVWDNDDAWYTRWRMISDAKQTIDCTYYIVDKDIFGQSFLGLLCKKAREGVKIRLMVDGRIYRSPYMKGMADRFQELARFSNVQIKLFNSVSQSLLHMFTDFKGLFASNHDKIIIADGKTSIIGGRNIGPDYYGDKGEYPIIYRDSDILMEGNHITARLLKAFNTEWNGLRNSAVKPDRWNWNDQMDRLNIACMVMDRYMYGKGLIDPKKVTNWTKKQREILTELNEEISKFKKISGFADFELWNRATTIAPVKVIDKESAIGKMNDITPCIVSFIDSANEEILIQNPYVVLTDQAYQALKRASARGVKIIFHSNSGNSTDSLFPQAFLMNDWKQMLKDMPTCRILVAPSQNERLHSKVFVFDSKITIIGSYNMDPLSEDKNSEIVAVVNDAQFGAETMEQMHRDMAVVLEYTIKINPDGSVEKVFGPEDHLNEKILKRMNLYRKLKWIRPVI
ncbi:MAG TPA: phosphatidylserine/phosphatidylglycerophosphate/cardiolipin synthase family protein [Candidatus Ozemobacteraceae bacterium]|nr:phosphatidylserine/phosphatidylglycerophosphate/cardiolipin synthase family protein [Candidatus Ozemobacteraceae bacterium]